jgi:hypothetical protein
MLLASPETEPRRRFFPLLEPAPNPPKVAKRPTRPEAFDSNNAQITISHRPKEKDEWVVTFWDGMVPLIGAAVVVWNVAERWLHSLPTPNDGALGPMRYAAQEEAKYWGDYRLDIQPRAGRKHFDRYM